MKELIYEYLKSIDCLEDSEFATRAVAYIKTFASDLTQEEESAVDKYNVY